MAFLCVADTAMAAPISLPPDSPIAIKFSNREQINTNIVGGIDVPDSATQAYGVSDNWGVFIVQSISLGSVTDPNHTIEDSGDPPFFVNGQNGGNQIYGIFYDSQITSAGPGGSSATGRFSPSSSDVARSTSIESSKERHPPGCQAKGRRSSDSSSTSRPPGCSASRSRCFWRGRIRSSSEGTARPPPRHLRAPPPHSVEGAGGHGTERTGENVNGTTR
jgi:hypothetical protein